MMIIAQLSGDDRITVDALSLRHRTPILAMCRALLARGVPPETELRCYRGEMLCITVRSIGAAAKITLEEDGTVAAAYKTRPYRPWSRDGAPRIDETDAPATLVA